VNDGRAAPASEAAPGSSRLGAILAVLCLTLAGCDADPAPSVKIVPRPIPEADASAGSGWGAEFAWRPELCPPPPESEGGPGTLVATGACGFRQQGMIACTSEADDFVIEMTRPAARGASLLLYVNVENYHGPGTYDSGEVLVGVQEGEQNFRWFSDAVRITVGADEKFAELAPARLDALPPGDETQITLSGTIWCRPATDARSSDG
jgi:hypothetical protein